MNTNEITRAIKVRKENGDHKWIVEYSNDTRYTTDYEEVASFISEATVAQVIEGDSGTTYTEYTNS